MVKLILLHMVSLEVVEPIDDVKWRLNRTHSPGSHPALHWFQKGLDLCSPRETCSHQKRVAAEHLKCGKSKLRFWRLSMKKRRQKSWLVFFISITFWNNNILKIVSWNILLRLISPVSTLFAMAIRKFKITYMDCICALHHIPSENRISLETGIPYERTS